MALRTTTEIMENALKAMKMCAEEWPEYQPDYRQMRDTVERLRTAAQGFGYVGRGVKR